MDTTKIITLTIIGIISIAISISFIQLFLRKEKIKSEVDGKFNLSFGVQILFWIISLSLLNLKSLSVLIEFVDLTYKINPESKFISIASTSVLFIGLIIIWALIFYFVSNIFSLLLTNKRDSLKEVENNNYVYFLIKGIIFLSFIYSLMPIFEKLLRIFLPSFEIPFYR